MSFKKILSVVLVFVILGCLMPTAAFAADDIRTRTISLTLYPDGLGNWHITDTYGNAISPDANDVWSCPEEGWTWYGQWYTGSTYSAYTLVLDGANFAVASGSAINLPNHATTVYAANSPSKITGGYILGTNNVIFKGNTTLEIDNSTNGIYSWEKVYIISGTLKTENVSYGIRAENSISISGGTVEAEASVYGLKCADFTMSGGTLDIKAVSAADVWGIYADFSMGDINISGGTARVTAHSSGGNAYGMQCENATTVSGGSVAFEGVSDSGIGYGMYAHTVYSEFDNDFYFSGGSVTAKGSTSAIFAKQTSVYLLECHGINLSNSMQVMYGGSVVYDGLPVTAYITTGSYSVVDGVPQNASTSVYISIPPYENPNGGYTFVFFEPNSGTGVMPTQAYLKYSGTAVELIQNTFAPPTAEDGFSGWNTQADGLGTSYSNQQAIYVEENMTLYAQWQDATGPVITSIDHNPSAWTTGNVTLTVNATDGGVGMANPNGAYSFNGGTTWQVSNQYLVTNQSATISIKVRDALGNESAVYTEPMNIDRIEPRGTIQLNTYTFSTLLTDSTYRIAIKTSASVSFTPTIQPSGCTMQYLTSETVMTEAQLAAATGWTAGNPTTINAPFKGFVYAKCTSGAGLVSYIRSEGFIVFSDSAQDTASISFNKGTTDNKTATVQLNGNTIYRIRDGSKTLVSGSDYTISSNIITFNASYLNSLAIGSYTLNISYYALGIVPPPSGDTPSDTTIALTIGRYFQTTPQFASTDAITKTYGDANFTLPTVSGGESTGAYAYESSNTSVVTVSGSGDTATVTVVGAGTATIKVKKLADSNYLESDLSAGISVTVNKKALNITGVAAVDREYNGNLGVTVNSSGAVLGGLLTGDTVQINYTAFMADKNAGQNKSVSFNCVVTTGGGNYYVASCAGATVNISKLQITAATITVNAKTYDGTTTAGFSTSIPNKVTWDEVGLTGGTVSFTSKTAGTNTFTQTTFTLTGADSANYQLVNQPTISNSVTIAKKYLPVINYEVNDKQYDGLNTATFSGTPAIESGIISGDQVTLVNGTPYFLSVTVSSFWPVLFSPGFSLSGADSGNYSVSNSMSVIAEIYNTYTPAAGTDYTVNSNNWLNTDFVISAKTGYAVSLSNTDAGPWSATLTYTNETAAGSVTFYVRNTTTKAISLSVTENYKIDKTAPTLAPTTGGTFATTKTVTANAADNSSGITATKWLAGKKTAADFASAGTAFSGSFTVTTPGYYTVYAVDNAGNQTVSVVGVTGDEPVVLSIETTSLSAAKVGTAYSQAIAVTYTGIDTVSYSATGLPGGLSINTATGVISGTPQAGTNTGSPYSVQVTATDGSLTDSETYSLIVTVDAPPAITTNSLSGGVVGTAYSATVSTTGSTPFTWSVISGALPGGLALNASTGVISGTPTAGGTFNFTVKAENSFGNDTKALSITISVPPTVTTSSLSGGVVGTVYSATVSATGDATITWSVSGGTLPGGLSMNASTGVISGTPTAGGTFNFTVKAENSVGYDTKALSITVSVPPTITTSSLSGGVVGTAYSATVSATGDATITWSVISGALPGGLALNATTGVISGTPTTGGTFNFTVKAENSVGNDTKALSITISAPPAITTSSLSGGVLGTAYSATVSATGSAFITWSVISGALPGGLSLNATTGVISGTPTAGGSFNFTVKAENNVGSDTKALSITIAVSPAITTSSLSGGIMGTPYSTTLSATGSVPFTWSVTAGALPGGLTLSTSTGTISGTPTAIGTFNFTVKAENSVGNDTKALSITINAPAPVITTSSLNSGAIGTPYSATLSATSMIPVTWSVTAGALPNGLTLTPAGMISGVPTVGGLFNFTIQAQNDTGTDSKALSLKILLPQTSLSINGIPAKVTYGDAPFTVGTSGGSGTGLVTLGISGETDLDGNSTTGVATINSSGLVTILKAGKFQIIATKAGDDDYLEQKTISGLITVNKAAQTVFELTGIPETVTYGDTAFTIGTSGGSGTGEITLGISNETDLSGNPTTGVATINSSGFVTILKAGKFQITATKEGDDSYTSLPVFSGIITVNQKAVTISGIGAADKDYDGTDKAVITGISTAAIIGKLNGDNLSIDAAYAFAAFSDSTAGNNKAVKFGGFALTGDDAGNYTLIQPASVKANIRQAAPDFILPWGLTASAGQTLADITLPQSPYGVFTFEDDLNTPVGAAGEHSFRVTFTPYDTVNYKTETIVIVIKVTGSAATSSTITSVTSKPNLSSTVPASSETSSAASDVIAPEMGNPASYLPLLLILLFSAAGFVLLKRRKSRIK